MTMCAFSLSLRSVAAHERSHKNQPELAGIIEAAAAEIERLTRDLAEARAEVARLTSYRDGQDKIEAQKDAEIERLRVALKPFAEAARRFGPYPQCTDDSQIDIVGITLGMLRAAARALNVEQGAAPKPSDDGQQSRQIPDPSVKQNTVSGG